MEEIMNESLSSDFFNMWSSFKDKKAEKKQKKEEIKAEKKRIKEEKEEQARIQREEAIKKEEEMINRIYPQLIEGFKISLSNDNDMLDHILSLDKKTLVKQVKRTMSKLKKYSPDDLKLERQKTLKAIEEIERELGVLKGMQTVSKFYNAGAAAYSISTNNNNLPRIKTYRMELDRTSYEEKKHQYENYIRDIDMVIMFRRAIRETGKSWEELLQESIIDFDRVFESFNF